MRGLIVQGKRPTDRLTAYSSSCLLLVVVPMSFERAERGAFRQRVRQWAEANADPAWYERLRLADGDLYRRMMSAQAAKLHAAGFLAPHWPTEFGGAGLSVEEQVALHQELSRARFPGPTLHSIALGHVAATLMRHGSPHQQRHLKAILGGEVWCQGFSESEAGSDLASVKTSAVQDGDHYVINGRKMWSTFAHLSDWCILLARTDRDAPKHRGLSVFILDLSLPGIDIRPIRQATGVMEFCEIFLDDVHVPTTELVGEENNGWHVANTTLATERVWQILEYHAQLEQGIELLAEECHRTLVAPGRNAAADPAVRQEFAACVADVDVLGQLAWTVLDGVARDGKVGPEGSVLKVFYSDALQRLTGLAARVRGVAADVDSHNVTDLGWISGDWMIDHIKSWTQTIAAGSNDIQRNIISERVLGLPREPTAWTQ